MTIEERIKKIGSLLDSSSALNLGNQKANVTADNIILNPPLAEMGNLHYWFGDLSAEQGSPDGTLTNYNIITMYNVFQGMKRFAQLAICTWEGSQRMYLRTAWGDFDPAALPFAKILDNRDADDLQQKITGHEAEELPHILTDSVTGTQYKWGFTLSDGVPSLIMEGVTENV